MLEPRRIFSPNLIAVATVLGGPLAGCILLARNSKMFGDLKGQRQILFSGLACTLLLFILGMTLPPWFPVILLYIASCAAIYEFARRVQEPRYAVAIANGTPHASLKHALVTGFFWMFVLMIMILAVALWRS